MALVTDKQAWVIGGALLVGGYLVYRARNMLNPANPGNVVNQTVNGVGQAVSGDTDWTLGGWLYEVTHPGEGYGLNPETAPLWWRLQNPEHYSRDTIMDGL
ncbi:hypothetical protein [Alloalcanivorax mobilis]|uniref:hypothetical protein n=1 Tax=Alloalcanivorax mobilis TaxID=2019569 RepID=UPI000C7707ED|nr:hypothetical protein [Alloalcanivorax mobilis]